ncbi:MAG: ABC transporter substrate-binding protein, partial [Chloroflexota bacterium]
GIINPFKEQYGIDVKIYRAGSKEVSSKILTEWDAGQRLCDTLDASDVPAFQLMKKRSMLSKYYPEPYDAIPDNLKDAEGYWTADRLTQIIIGYNTQVITGDMVPTGWADLADPKYKDKMVLQEPATFIQRIYTVADKMGWDWLDKIGANKPKFVQTVQVMGQMNETGEIPVSIFQNDNIMNRSKTDNNRPVDLVFPKEGLPTEPGGIGLMGECAHPNAGKLLIDWWLGETGQKLNVAGYKYSPRADIDPPKGCPPLKELNLWTEDNDYIEAHQQELQDKIAKALGSA